MATLLPAEATPSIALMPGQAVPPRAPPDFHFPPWLVARKALALASLPLIGHSERVTSVQATRPSPFEVMAGKAPPGSPAASLASTCGSPNAPPGARVATITSVGNPSVPLGPPRHASSAYP